MVAAANRVGEREGWSLGVFMWVQDLMIRLWLGEGIRAFWTRPDGVSSAKRPQTRREDGRVAEHDRRKIQGKFDCEDYSQNPRRLTAPGIYFRISNTNGFVQLANDEPDEKLTAEI